MSGPASETPPVGSRSNREFDVVLWGATGYTGRLVADYLASRYGRSGLRLAVAGRSVERLERLRRELSSRHDVPPPAALTGDSLDPGSLDVIARRAAVVCTTVGPYREFGGGLVAACVARGTDYCDLAGEVSFMASVVRAHHQEAARTGARIVHCCGFDAIPTDLGTLMLNDAMADRYGAPCVEVRTFLEDIRGKASGGSIRSGCGELEAAANDPSVNATVSDAYALNPPSDKPRPPQPDQQGIRLDRAAHVWTAPSPFARINTRVVRRSAELLGYGGDAGFSYSEAMGCGAGPVGLGRACAVAAGMGAYRIVARVPWLWRPLARAFAPAPGQGPKPQELESGRFAIRLIGFGRARDGRSVTIEGRVAGERDPGYAETSVMLGESAVCLALDKARTGGGVHTPASAMGPPLLDRLRKAGLTFEVVR